MKLVRNLTRTPLRLSLPGGGILHIGPNRTAEISDQAAEAKGLKKRVKAGEIEILDAGGVRHGRPASATAAHEAVHGHPQDTLVVPKGNR